MRIRTCVAVAAILLSTPALAMGGKKEESKMPKNPVVVMETNQGTIEIKLFPDIAPKACENFLRLAEEGYCSVSASLKSEIINIIKIVEEGE